MSGEYGSIVLYTFLQQEKDPRQIVCDRGMREILAAGYTLGTSRSVFGPGPKEEARKL